MASFSASTAVIADESSTNNIAIRLRLRTVRLGLGGYPSHGPLKMLRRDEAERISMSMFGWVAEIPLSERSRSVSWYRGGEDGISLYEIEPESL